MARVAIMFACIGVPAVAAAQVCPLPQTPIRRGVFHPDEAASTTEADSRRAVIPTGSVMEGDAPAVATTDAPPGPSSLIYQFSVEGNEAGTMNLAAADANSIFMLAAYGCDGEPVVASAGAGAEQELIIEGGPEGFRGFLEVTLENPSAMRSRHFTLSYGSARPATSSGSLASRGYAFRGALTSAEYRRLTAFAVCDSAALDDCDPPCDKQCWQDAQIVMHRLLRFDPGENDPIVAFIGISGSSRIVLADRSGGAPIPPHYRTLGPAKYLWVVYVEDMLAPYQTSIDVEFKQRATVGEFDEFDAAGQVNTAGSPLQVGVSRAVRVGLKRLRVRRPPSAIEITFSRVGAGYGLRQWRRAYKVYAWKPVMLGAGAFIPATEVTYETHQLDHPGLPDGGIANFVVIQPRIRYRQVFAIGSLMWPAARARADEAARLPGQIGWHAIPDVVFGVGLPTTGNQVYYLGGAWPLSWNRLSVTGGATIIRQSRLRPGFKAGDRLTDLTTLIETVAYKKRVYALTFGITFDFLRVY